MCICQNYLCICQKCKYIVKCYCVGNCTNQFLFIQFLVRGVCSSIHLLYLHFYLYFCLLICQFCINILYFTRKERTELNIIKVNIDFEQGICQNKGISVVTGDYNSTKVVFDFTENGEEESAATRKVFEMKNPSGELVYVDEIVNNEVVLVGEEDDTMYSLFGEAGDYTFEVSLYGEDSKLTSVCGYITAKEEQVIVDGEVVETQITLFDNLMQELVQNVEYAQNLNVEAEKVEHTTTITITRKDGTTKEVEIEDGLDGISIENMEIVDRHLVVTYDR